MLAQYMRPHESPMCPNYPMEEVRVYIEYTLHFISSSLHDMLIHNGDMVM